MIVKTKKLLIFSVIYYAFSALAFADNSSGGLGSKVFSQQARLVEISGGGLANIMNIEAQTGLTRERVNLEISEVRKSEALVKPMDLTSVESDYDPVLRVSKEKHDSILNELDHTEKAKVPGTDLTVAKFNDKIMTTDLRIEVKVKSEEE